MDPRSTRTALMALLLVATIAAGTSQAELIYFRAGGGAQVPAKLDGDRVILRLPGGDVTFLRDDFRLIVNGFNPEAEWPSRLSEAQKSGTPTRFDAAWWALENGLISEASAEFRSIHRDDPKHTPSARIVAALDRLDRPAPEPHNLDAFAKALGIPTSKTLGPHVVLLHQHSEAEASERVAHLERIVVSYYILLAGQGIELAAPPRRQVMAWFAHRTDYLAFLHSENADAFKTTLGYFHPTWNAVVTYDERSSEARRFALRSIDARREALRRFDGEIRRIPKDGTRRKLKLETEPARLMTREEAQARRDRLEAEIQLAEIRNEFDRQAFELGTATHEMIHQLVANSGLLPRHDAFPIWMHEGFAAQFEVIRGGRWAGISRAHDLRMPDWRAIHPPPKLEPLIRDSGYGKGYQRELYAQAWALVYFLRIQHPDRFLTFLDLLRNPGTILVENEDQPAAAISSSPGRRAAAAFHRVFGDDLAPLEQEWHNFLNSVQPPLERHNPIAKDRFPRSS